MRWFASRGVRPPSYVVDPDMIDEKGMPIGDVPYVPEAIRGRPPNAGRTGEPVRNYKAAGPVYPQR